MLIVSISWYAKYTPRSAKSHMVILRSDEHVINQTRFDHLDPSTALNVLHDSEWPWDMNISLSNQDNLYKSGIF